ncbi:MAG TPA: hypothetical protein VMU54_18480 [Planctomycetota bacterium]|nr:hypothetical protein [Planctomycetota bacterium]
MRLRQALVPILLGLGVSCGRPVTDFSGVWRMTETDAKCKHTYSQCWVLIEQQGDRATVHSWGGDGWKCTGRGSVDGTRLQFRWGGGAKEWHGTAILERSKDELHGTYQRDEAGAVVQYCRGAYVRQPEEKP